MHKPTPLRLSIFGAGKLGQTLAHLWQAKGCVTIGQVVCQHTKSAKDAVAFIGAGNATTPENRPAGCDIWLLSCPDQVLPEAARWIAQQPLHGGQVVFHCAGSLNHTALEDAQPAQLASVHPVHAFSAPSDAIHTLTGSYCVAEGSDTAKSLLKPLFTALECQWLELDARSQDAKALYHAATVAASNHLVTLIDQALRLAEFAGLSRTQAAELLRPLATQNLDKTLQGPAQAVLTGPVSRGDTRTLAAHFSALAHSEVPMVDQQLYRQLAESTLAIARHQGDNAEARLTEIQQLIDKQLSLLNARK